MSGVALISHGPVTEIQLDGGPLSTASATALLGAVAGIEARAVVLSSAGTAFCVGPI